MNNNINTKTLEKELEWLSYIIDNRISEFLHKKPTCAIKLLRLMVDFSSVGTIC